MVLVTGATGLVGSHLLHALAEDGEKIRALYRTAAKIDQVKELFEWYGEKGITLFEKIEWIAGDITEIPSLEKAFEGVKTVYHTAAYISFDPKNEEKLLKANYEGTANIVNMCLAKGVGQLCYTSSIATISGNKDILDEEDHWDAAHSNVYATSKYLAEMEVWRGGEEGLKIAIVNPGVIFGPGNWRRGSGWFFTRLASGIQYYPPGGTGFVGVWDVVKAMRKLMESGIYQQRFILVGENLSFKNVFDAISKLLGATPPEKELKSWMLEVLWRADWLRCALGGGKRQLSKAVAHSLKNPKKYDNRRICKAISMDFQPMENVLRICSRHFKDTSGA